MADLQDHPLDGAAQLSKRGEQGGVAVASFFTLLVIPVLYSLVDGGAYCADACVSPSTFYRDADGDGYGDPAVSTAASAAASSARQPSPPCGSSVMSGPSPSTITFTLAATSAGSAAR